MSLRQYAITLPAAASPGAITPLLWNRTDAGVAAPCDSQSSGKSLLTINFPRKKRDGSSNPTNTRVLIFATDTDTAPVFANAIQLVELQVAGVANLPMIGDFGQGYVWACTDGGTPVEIHCTESRA